MRLAAAALAMALAAAACTTSSSEPTTSAPTTTAAGPTTTNSASTTSEAVATTEPVVEIELGAQLGEVGAITGKVVGIIPHDPTAPTQGLAWTPDSLVESTGAYGSSQRRRLSPISAQTSQAQLLELELLATDVAIVGDSGIQLSAREGIATLFALDDLSETSRLIYEGEGWGICSLETTVVTSDDTNRLTTRDSQTLDVVSEDEIGSVDRLRALECINGLIYAVVGETNNLAIIDLGAGEIVGLLDLAPLLPARSGPNDVLSAVAYDRTAETFFVAGKRWGVVYEITIETP